MEARILRAASLAALLVVSMGASFRTPNFLIQTSDPRLAEQFGQAAEQFRRDLAIAWLGKPMPEWSQPCVVTAHVGPNLGAGGATTFVFDRGEVFGWRMTIQGSAQRILDSVLPHEITHMIFACRFRSPLPRWADEGGATSVEHSSERAKHYRMLVEFLRSNRGIAFNRMFSMDEYPRDIMPLYAQGYTLAEFLIQQGGRTKFLDFLSDGMQDDQWSLATSRHYGYQDVGTLQNAWLAWVRQGFPRVRPSGNPANAMARIELLAERGKRPRPEPNLIRRIGKSGDPRSDTQFAIRSPRPSAAVLAGSNAGPVARDASPSKVLPTSGWHAVGERPASSPAAVAVAPARAEPVRTQVTHPQPIGRPHQTILEWGRR